MAQPAATIGLLDVGNSPTVAATERRRRLPALTTRQLFDSTDRDFSRFALSPLTSNAHAGSFGAALTPLTAVPIKPLGINGAGPKSPTLRSPIIRAPGTPLRTTLLYRYLSEASDGEEFTGSPFPAPLTLAGAGISDALPTPGTVVNWSLVMGSPPETNSDCFSPVFGTGSAEQLLDEPTSALSGISEGDPKSAQSAKSVSSTRSMPVHPQGLLVDFGERRVGRLEQAADETYQKAKSSEAGLSATNLAFQCSPTETENTFIEEEFGDCEAPLLSTMSSPAKIRWPRRNSFPQLLPKKRQAAKLAVTFNIEDKDIPLPSLRSAPLEFRRRRSQQPTLAISQPSDKRTKVMTPPPAPVADCFADSLPEVKICIERSPFSPPPAPTFGSFPVSLPDPIATIHPSPFDPPPAPTTSQFREEFPASPVHAGPCPIDTAIPFTQWRRSVEPSSAIDFPILPDHRFKAVLASIDPPPAPTQARFTGFFPASPIRSKPAPINTVTPPMECNETSGHSPKLPPPPPLSEHFNVKSTGHRRNVPNSMATVNGTGGTKPTKSVRFAVLDSPTGSTHFKTPLSPHPWTPRGFSRMATSTSVEPDSSEILTPLPEDEGPSITDVLLDGTIARGRAGDKLKKAGRQTRSVSPKRSRRNEPASPNPTLPSTVYDPESNQPYQTDSPVFSDKYIILQTYFSPGRLVAQG